MASGESSPVEAVCYAVIVILTIVSNFTDKIPIHVNLCGFSLAIIIAGSYRSLFELARQMKNVHVKKIKSQNIESLSSSEAMQFPISAGIMLVSLYFAIQYFGKEYVNYALLTYMAFGCATPIKGLLDMLQSETLDKLDEKKLLDFTIPYFDQHVEVSIVDLITLIISGIAMIIYVYTKNWIYNNAIAILFCIHAIQLMFLGSFKTGFLMLTLLFFYDIFFVFGTDVMLTVAKNIDAPIKLLFPKDWSESPPKYSLLGLGDIVIPGVFIAMALRFDVLKTLDVQKMNTMLEKGQDSEFMQYIMKQVHGAPRTYFIGQIVGYMIAIICTVVVMLIFDHGQPALLYLVPACLLGMTIVSLVKGEFKTMWNWNEEEFIMTKEQLEELHEKDD